LKQKVKNRLIVNAVAIFVGVVIGLAVNLGWYIFRGLILGWGDSAPNWYFHIQDHVHNGIIMVSVAICIVFGNIYIFPKQTQ
jgi:uncharacterized membrane protein